MAEVIVTRADRVLAIRALGYHPNASAPAWIESGTGSFCGTYDEADRIALAIAKARAEGFADGREAAVFVVEQEAGRMCASGNKTKGLIAGALYHVANMARQVGAAGKERGE